MTVIAVMPAAGLMISWSKLVQMGGGDIAAVMTIGTTMENIGWAVINNLHPVRRGHRRQLGKERAGTVPSRQCWHLPSSMGSPATSSATSAMLKEPNAGDPHPAWQEIAVNGYFTSGVLVLRP